MVYPYRKIVLDPATDQKVIDRIAHARVCKRWNIPENRCQCADYKEWDKLTTEEKLKIAKANV